MRQDLRTDLDIVQLPATLAFPSRNVIQTDPDFKTQIVRLTDTSIAANRSLQTADSAQQCIWNLDDTMILVRATNTKTYLFQFDPIKLQGTAIPFACTKDVSFSKVKPFILYELIGTVIYQINFTRVNNVWTYQGKAQVCDFSCVLPKGFKPTWNSVFVGSHFDNTFSVAFSDQAQGTAIYACVYQRGKGSKGYRVLNTNTGIVSSDKAAYPIVLTSTNTKLPFTMHECYQTENDNYVILSALKGGDTSLVWDIANNTLIDDQLTGHKAHGYLYAYGGGPGGGQLAESAYSNPTSHSNVVLPGNVPRAKGQKYTGDRHFQFGKVDLGDKSVIWSSGSGTISPDQPFVSAWQNEVTGYDVQKGIVYRACHTFNTGKSKEFVTANAIAVPSQTGNFVAFTSDMMGTLGSTSGAAVGTPGVDARGDVFIAKVG